MPKYLHEFNNGYNLIYVPLEGDYIINYKNFIIESKKNTVYLNNKELEFPSTLIDESGKVFPGRFINTFELSQAEINKLRSQQMIDKSFVDKFMIFFNIE